VVQQVDLDADQQRIVVADRQAEGWLTALVISRSLFFRKPHIGVALLGLSVRPGWARSDARFGQLQGLEIRFGVLDRFEDALPPPLHPSGP